MKKSYKVKGIDCANCAAKIEAKIRTLPEVAGCNVTFATKQMRITAQNPDALLPLLQMALAVLNGDHSFDSIGVDAYTPQN